MSDRELLELAAKAAGYEISECTCKNSLRTINKVNRTYHWNPLTDDGDALRLAIACKIDILTECDDGTVGTISPNGNEKLEVADGDVYAAVRHAIARAAAEIGRAIP